ncbi:MAG: hydantoinase B/oxoprolinase family protein, partial [Candidatus Bathyarchaeia archaeon]
MSKVDPIKLEVIRNRFISAVREMWVALYKTAYSSIIYEVKDYANVIMDRNVRLVAQAEGIPIFNGALLPAVKAAIEKFGIDGFTDGDVIISNDPYTAGGTHKNDVNVIVPVFWQQELAFFAASKAHWGDIGGKDPGSWSPDCATTFQEGVSIPPVKIFREGKTDKGVMDLIFANVRMPEAQKGDFRAQIAACSTGKRRILEILDRYGAEITQQYVDELISHTERMVREEIDRYPDGTYVDEDYQDPIEDETPVKIRLETTVKGSDLTFDFTGSSDQGPFGGNNMSYAVTLGSTMLGVKCMTDPTLPPNHGFLNPVKISTRKGSCVDTIPPAAQTVGLCNVARSVIELVIRTLSQALPERAIAGTFGGCNAMAIGGYDIERNRPYIHFMPYSGSWGARATKDGLNAVCSIVNGDQHNVPCEFIETRYPLLVERYCLRENSGGAGQFRGGLGLTTDYRLLKGDAVVSCGMDRSYFAPPGIFNGKEGAPNVLLIVDPTGKETEASRAGGVLVKEGSLISNNTGGSGGYG